MNMFLTSSALIRYSFMQAVNGRFGGVPVDLKTRKSFEPVLETQGDPSGWHIHSCLLIRPPIGDTNAGL